MISWHTKEELYLMMLEDQGLIPGMSKEFSLCKHVQTVSGTHPDCLPVGTRGYFPERWRTESVNLTTHFHIMLRIRTQEVTHFLP
jgi:hypothetical protein